MVTRLIPVMKQRGNGSSSYKVSSIMGMRFAPMLTYNDIRSPRPTIGLPPALILVSAVVIDRTIHLYFYDYMVFSGKVRPARRR
jgi:hypothetical protein